jgi:hypothetical protein
VEDGFLERQGVRGGGRGRGRGVGDGADWESERLFVEVGVGVSEGRRGTASDGFVRVELATSVGEEDEEAGLREREKSVSSFEKEEEKGKKRTRRRAALICPTPQNVNGRPVKRAHRGAAMRGQMMTGMREMTRMRRPVKRRTSFRGSCEFPARSWRNEEKEVRRDAWVSSMRSAKAEGGRKGSTE